MRFRWRFVGREREIETVSDGVERGVGAVVMGPAGVGKTALVNVVADRLGDGGRRVERILGMGSTALPLEPFARLLPTGDDVEDPRRRFGHVVDALRPGSPGDPPTLLVVDDAPHLDDLSGEILVQLAGTGAATVVATARGEDPPPDWLVRLWRLGQRVDLGEFSIDELGEVLRGALGNDVDSACVRTFARLSVGNALALRELVVASLDDGVLVERGGVWVLDGSPSVGAALVDLIGNRLRDLPRDLREGLELIALGEPLPLAAAVLAVGSERLEELEERRLVRITDAVSGPVVAAAHPLWGEVVRSGVAPLRARRLRMDLARSVDGDDVPASVVRAATWRLEAGAADDPAALVGAAAAARPFSADIAERLARASVDADPTVSSVTLLASILTSRGAGGEAASLLAALPPSDLRADDRELVLFMQSVGTGLLGGDPKAGLALLEGPGASTRLRGMQSSLLLVDGRVRDAHRAAVAVLDGADADESARAVAGIGAIGSLFYLGGFRELRRRLDIAERDATNQLLANPHGLGQILVNAYPALAEEGAFDEAERLGRARLEATSVGDGPSDRSRWEYTLGRVALLRGELLRAERHLRRASATPSPFDLPFHPYNVTFLARALAGTGAAGAARDVLAEIDPALPRFRLFETEHELAEAAILAAEGSLPAAAERAAWAAELAAVRELWTVVLIAAHDAARYGGARLVHRLALDTADRVQAPLPAARAAFVVAQAAEDGGGLDAATAAFEELGANLFAAESAAQAARAHRLAGRAAAAAAGHVVSRRLLGACPGAVCPWLLGVTAPDPLTPREQEIAILAAAGRHDAELADELGISIRTVQTHLGRVYMKLGIHSRLELAEALIAEGGAST